MARTSLLLLAAALFLVGCGEDELTSGSIGYTGEERLAHGLVIILPGIEGESGFNHDIRRGLAQGGIPGALPIYHWGRPVPIAGVLLNQMDFVGNRLQGEKIAKMIVQYQQSYPGQPVHVIGHSGGGGVAVFTAEAMPPGHKIDGLVLLSASISTGYDLTKALANCKKGLLNVYNRNDTALLVVGTTITSTVDGVKGPSAGCENFSGSFPTLYPFPVSDGMTDASFDPHGSTTRAPFIATYVVPWLNAAAWPVGGAR